MRPTHHHLAHDFPELKERLESLLASDAPFQRLYTEYEQLDSEIFRIETDNVFVRDEDMETLKKKRALLKDQLYARLNKTEAAPA